MAIQPRNLKAAAEVALCGYKRQGNGADPRNPEHVAAYVAMRQCCQRIPAQAIMDHLQNQVKDVGSGARVITPFWAVPKVYYPKGLPDDVAQLLVDEETLENMQLRSGGTIDRET